MPKWIIGSDGNLQKVPDEVPVESIAAEAVAPAPIPAPIPNPDNIPGISEVQPAEKFRILETYGSMSYEDLYALHYNREKGRACSLSDDDLLKQQAELEVIQAIGKIRQRIYEDTRLERIEDAAKSSREKQKLKDSTFKIKNRETIKKEAEAKEAKEKKPRESQAEQMARFMGISVAEATEILESKKGK